MTGSRNLSRILAIDPISRGFGFAVLEGPTTLVDWGIRNISKGDSKAILRKVRTLIALYGIDIIVIEDCRDRSSRRRRRMRAVLEQVRALAVARTEVLLIPLPLVCTAFEAGKTKRAIATAVAEHFPELRFHLPPERKPWMTEDARMSIFDATALALAAYRLGDGDPPADSEPVTLTATPPCVHQA